MGRLLLLDLFLSQASRWQRVAGVLLLFENFYVPSLDIFKILLLLLPLRLLFFLGHLFVLLLFQQLLLRFPEQLFGQALELALISILAVRHPLLGGCGQLGVLFGW